jgi:hypothetical protein
MISAALALLVVATLEGTQALPVIAPDGAPPPDRVEVEWIGPGSKSLGLVTLPVTDRKILLATPPPGAESLRVVGPDVVSQPLLLTDLQSGIRLARAGKLRVTGIPHTVRALRVFLKLESSDLEFARDVAINGQSEMTFAVPLGSYSAAIDLGPERVPMVTPAIVIGIRSVAVVKIKESTGTPLIMQVITKEDGRPLAGASISGKPTAELPPVFWRALAARCGVSQPSGDLSCGMVPLTLHNIDVLAPQRRRSHVSVAARPPKSDPSQPVQVKLAHFQNVAIKPSLTKDYPAATD